MSILDWGSWSEDVAGGTLSTSESQSIWGFTESDWFSDIKEVSNLWGFFENGGKMQNAGQIQAEQMYSVPVDSRPNAQYLDPRNIAQSAGNAVAGISTTYIIAGVGILALAYLVIKK